LRATKGWSDRRNALGEAGFGQAPELLCPFFDRVKNNCGIWNYRPGVCANYFCRSSLTQNTWKNSEASINLVEWTLAHQVLWELGLTKDETDAIAETGEWFEFGADKEAFFRRCYEKALRITPDEVEELLGFEM
jgi:Fe-S-cluster containining protein